jgi:methionyl-tRNA formyltransferase
VIGGNEVQIYESAIGRKSGRAGSVLSVEDEGVAVAPSDGSIVVRRLRPKGGKKLSAGEHAREIGLSTGTLLGA